MKCPKCGYQSFNNITACKKCGRNLTQEQQKLNLGNPVVVPQPIQTPAEPPSAATEVMITPAPAAPAPAAPTPAPVDAPQQKPQEKEQGLEDFFLSIDDQDQDQVPSAIPLAKQPHADTREHSPAKRQASAEVPQWSQESPQGDFPFDEIDSDLDALRLSHTEEPATEGASPFDDVDTFAINWQLPVDEVETIETKPAAVDKTASQGSLTKKEEPQREMPAAVETLAKQPETVPAERTAEAKPAETETKQPSHLSANEPQTSDEEWTLPELPADHQTEKAFTLEEPCEEEQKAAATPDPQVTATQPLEIQKELPQAAREIEVAAERANIAAVFQPDAEPDPIARGVRLLTRRAQASLADLGLLTAIFALFICAGEISRSPATGERFRFNSDVLLDLATPYFLVFFALCFGYFTLFHYLSGQTPGKMLFDVRVEGEDHAGITLAQAFLRCVGGLVALLPAGLGFLSIVLDEEQRGWNDRLAGCQVVILEELEGD